MPLEVQRKSNGYFNQAFLSATYKTTKAFGRFTNKYTLQDSKGLLVESNWSGCPPSLRLLLAALLTTYLSRSFFSRTKTMLTVLKTSTAIASNSVVEVYFCQLLATFVKLIG